MPTVYCVGLESIEGEIIKFEIIALLTWFSWTVFSLMKLIAWNKEHMTDKMYNQIELECK